VLGENHKKTSDIAASFIYFLQDTKQHMRESEVWAELASDLRRKRGGSDQGLAIILAQQGHALIKAGKLMEAGPVLRECLSICEKKEPDDWMTFYTRSLLGESLLGLMKYAEGEALLLSGYEGMKQREAKIPPEWSAKDRLREAMERLVRFYNVTGKPDLAAKWRKEVDAAK
jgi:hypothetical protein